MKVFLVAGEASGDQLGAGLIRVLREIRPSIDVTGIGGAAMAREGLTSLFPISDIAVMGVLPVIARLPRLLKRLRETVDAVLEAEPDILVIIDSPDFTHRVARRVRRLRPGIPIVDYVSPTVWAWRPGRARKMRAYVDHVLALLPFEPAAHRRLGGPPCTYVGHPLIDRLDALRPNDEEKLARETVPPLVLVVPGSRQTEVKRLLNDFGAALDLIRAAYGPIDAVLPAVPHLEALIRQGVAGWSHPPRIITREAEKFAAFRKARAGLAASGTVTLELALAGVPQCVAYKVSWAESFLKYAIKVPSIVLPNLILDHDDFGWTQSKIINMIDSNSSERDMQTSSRNLHEFDCAEKPASTFSHPALVKNEVPEFLQEACTPRNLAEAMLAILRDGPRRDAQLAAFDRLSDLMRLDGGESPARRAAEVVLAAACQRTF